MSEYALRVDIVADPLPVPALADTAPLPADRSLAPGHGRRSMAASLAPASANKALSGIRGVLRVAWRLSLVPTRRISARDRRPGGARVPANGIFLDIRHFCSVVRGDAPP